MKITIEVDADPEEFTGEVEIRPPRAGDAYVDDDIQASVATLDWARNAVCLVRKQKYPWPANCTAWGWAMDANGQKFLFANRPTRAYGDRWVARFNFDFLREEAANALGYPTPEITDWMKPVLNPHYKEA